MRTRRAQTCAIGLADQIGLAQQGPVGETDLLLSFVKIVELGLGVSGNDDRDDRIKGVAGGDLVVDEESLATGAGSARPVVSMITRLNASGVCSRRWCSSPRMRTRSPRTVQQMQPLFISTICSSPLRSSRSLWIGISNAISLAHGPVAHGA